MNSDTSSKVMDLKTAVGRYVRNGMQIAIGGFTVNRNPMAAVYEIIRQRITDLHLVAHSNGQGVDELIGSGCVSTLEIAYGGSGRFAPTCVRFRQAVQLGKIAVEDYSNYQMALRFMAGAMGIPFMPTRSALGSDIINKWGFSKAERRKRQRLPNRKLVVIDNPFDDWLEADQLVLVPALTPDVTIVHVQKADCFGTARIEGLPFVDVEQIKAARTVILTCDELVEADSLRENPDLNQIPFFCVDAVIQIPYGAYPTACYRYYDYDPIYLNDYRKAAADEKSYQTYLEQFVYGIPNHAGLTAKIGESRLEKIRADARTGYASGLDRR
jgi:glutaconate CoA-transferase subunit A